ncbi:hypothetical protein BGZ65_006024 [Modicella reniformis]|uniref:DUF6589 domain-containing protein n=1 Tax=Modicella reniformis TaxID=1440133 RepID=A0A9P6JHA8_9FUNG|nr:hypothetical protein BGZ65_006024 [Modicella reniformis]
MMTILSKVGMSVTRQSVSTSLKGLTEDALREVRLAVLEHPWFLVYDNINFPNKKYDQRTGNTDSFENGTTATVVIAERPVNMKDGRNSYELLSVKDLAINEVDWLHFVCVSDFQFAEVLRRHFKTYKRFSNPVRPKEVLKTKKTEKELRARDVSRYARLEWAVPVMQLFHLQMLLCNTILRNHYGSITTPGSLAFFASMLERKRVHPDRPDYHAMEELLRHVFDAMVIRVWEVLLGTENLDTFGKRLNNVDIKKIMSLTLPVIRTMFMKSAMELQQTYGPANVNAGLFFRDMILFIELSDAIKVGDIGRIEDVLKWLTIMFQAGMTKNYANELLHLQCGLRHGWSAETRQAIMASWLINTKGKEDSWIPTDLHQEHNNLLTKTIHSAKGSNASWEMLAESISTNIHVFSKVAQQLETAFGVTPNCTQHTTVSPETDIMRIVRSLRQHNILGHDPRPQALDDVPLVRDLYAEGFMKLSHGRLTSFIQSNMNRQRLAEEDSMEVEEGLEVEEGMEVDEIDETGIEQYVEASLG